MREGKVTSYDAEFRAGKITADNGEQISFRVADIEPQSVPTVGQLVTFEPLPRRRIRVVLIPQLNAEDVAPQEDAPPVVAAPEPTVAPVPHNGPYRFLNPYNFARFLGAGTTTDAETALLGRCTPPPHDRYLGLTGKLTCTLTTTTPLFVSDSEDWRKDPNEKEHKIHRFFRLDGKHAIPATSLRGLVRNVFEIVTNSCFSQLDNAQLDYRLPATQAPSWKPAVVTKLPDVGAKSNGEVQLLESAWVHKSLINSAITALLAPHLKKATWDSVPDYFDKVLQDQMLPIEAAVRERIRERSPEFRRRPKTYSHAFNEVTQILSVGTLGTGLQKPAGGSNFWGYLKITGPNVVAEDWGSITLRKHDERFFYWDGKSSSTASIPYQDISGKPNACQRYNAVRKAQKDPANQQLPYQTYLQNETLTVGDLVWVAVANHPGGPTVTQIGSVSIPKLRYQHPVADLLPGHLTPCSVYQELCPACRVFGWVRQLSKGEQVDTNEAVAYAGRLTFSHGKLQGQARELHPGQTIPLAILSSPKPTTTYFYLLKKGAEDFGVTYDTKGASLRGRKVYRHHGEVKKREYWRESGAKTRDKQNRSVKGVLDKGNHFTFDIHFENLAPLELGALLWALELEQGWHHRLGFAKPLGFGSATIGVTRLELTDMRQRYESLTNDGQQTFAGNALRDKARDLVADFKATLVRRHKANNFDKLLNIQDLSALLQAPSKGLPVHYPRPPYQEHGRQTSAPDPEGKQYEWFVGNKKRRHTLPLAATDQNGFCLIDKNGYEASNLKD